jgi:hypothetical protein
VNTERAIELIPLSGFKVLRKRELNFFYKNTVNGEEPIYFISAPYYYAIIKEAKLYSL